MWLSKFIPSSHVFNIIFIQFLRKGCPAMSFKVCLTSSKMAEGVLEL